jgi:hypothetical protein
VRNEYRRQVEAPQQLVELDPNGRLCMRIERRERLVEQEHARVACKRARQCGSLPLAA